MCARAGGRRHKVVAVSVGEMAVGKKVVDLGVTRAPHVWVLLLLIRELNVRDFPHGLGTFLPPDSLLFSVLGKSRVESFVAHRIWCVRRHRRELAGVVTEEKSACFNGFLDCRPDLRRILGLQIHSNFLRWASRALKPSWHIESGVSGGTAASSRA